LSKSNPNIQLIFSTGESHDKSRKKSIEGLIEGHGLTKRVQYLGCLEQKQYHELIYRSKGIIYPSFAEGFGIPLLEGIIANKNIACSQISALIEITNGKALYFNPYDENEIKHKIELLWEKRYEKSNLDDRRNILDKYSLKNQVIQYVSLYTNIYHHNITKYRPSIKSNGESILESANALFHSKLFNTPQKNLYTFSSDLYKDTTISELIQHPKIEKINESKIISTQKTVVILMDVTRLFTRNPYSGISKYVENTLQQLMNVSSIVIIPLYNRKARGFSGDRNSEQNYLHKFQNSSIVSILEANKATKLACHLNHLPVIYFSGYHPLPQDRNSKWKYCITIFDVIHLTETKYYPNGSDSKKYITSDIVNSIIPTDMILPISRYTLNDIKRCLSFSLRASIVYLAPGISKSVNNYKYRNIDILILFQNDPRKGFQRMLNIVFNILENTNSPKKLTICFFGRPGLNSDNSFRRLVSKSPNLISFVASPDQFVLVDLYKKSKCFLYLSEAEGFGMPPLEAMSCGSIPVILNNTSLSEIFSGWLYLLDKQASDKAIISRVLEILCDKNFDTLSNTAVVFASKFTWENTRDLHLAAFAKLLER
jgi:hypothetical protein